MAKRAATPYSLVAEEYAGDSSSGDESGFNEWLKYKLMPGREPEWDVDSFDGREFKMNPRVRKLFPTQELYDEYYNERLQAFESKGFLPDPLNGIYQVYLEGPMKKYNTARDFVADLANVCVKKAVELKDLLLFYKNGAMNFVL